MLSMNDKPDQTAVSEEATFFARYGQKLIAMTFWLLLLGGLAWYYFTSGLTFGQIARQIVALLESPYGPLLYIVVYAIRPLIFFSAAVLTISAGAVFGAGSIWNLALAVIYTIIASNISATVAYLIGRFFGKGLLKETEDENANLVQRYAGRMRRNSFETIMIMRFILLPYDLVNYLAGILRIRWISFILATIIGSIPGTIAYVSFGASIDIKEIAAGARPTFDYRVFLFGAVIMVISIGISQYFKRREGIES